MSKPTTSSGNSAGLGLDLDLVEDRSGKAEDGEDDGHPMRPISSTLSMRSAASGYKRRPSIHDTSAMDAIRQSLNQGRLSEPSHLIGVDCIDGHAEELKPQRER